MVSRPVPPLRADDLSALPAESWLGQSVRSAESADAAFHTSHRDSHRSYTVLHSSYQPSCMDGFCLHWSPAGNGTQAGLAACPHHASIEKNI